MKDLMLEKTEDAEGLASAYQRGKLPIDIIVYAGGVEVINEG